MNVRPSFVPCPAFVHHVGTDLQTRDGHSPYSFTKHNNIIKCSWVGVEPKAFATLFGLSKVDSGENSGCGASAKTHPVEISMSLDPWILATTRITTEFRTEESNGLQ